VTTGHPQEIRILRVAGGGALEKARSIVSAYPAVWSGTVLDAGCRNQELRQALAGRSVRCVGLDIHPPADLLADLDEGIPMEDDRADVVVALDVLEHTNAIHHAFDELCRVARRHVVIALPNQYESTIGGRRSEAGTEAASTGSRSIRPTIGIGGCSRSRRHGPSAGIELDPRAGA
jgi:hypothetical protein